MAITAKHIQGFLPESCEQRERMERVSEKDICNEWMWHTPKQDAELGDYVCGHRPDSAIQVQPSRSMEFPYGHEAFEDAVTTSRYIRDLKDDWDEEGSPGYEGPVWQRSVRFLMALTDLAYRSLDVVLDAPRILPGPEGTIDLHWKRDRYELLVNIPESPDEPATYYGDNRFGNMPIKGSCEADRPDRKLVLWLMLMQEQCGPSS